MLVGERMTKPVITAEPSLTISEALNLMRLERIRRIPVVQDGKLIGIVSDKDLLNASPSVATSLSVWEMNYLLSKITVKDVMTKKVLTVSEDTPIEEAARIMADNKIGGLPVVRAGKVVGIITETDLFKIFLELMGAREPGVRGTVLMTEKAGQLAALTKVLSLEGANFVAVGTFAGEDSANRMITFKVSNINKSKVEDLIKPLVEKIIDLRES